MADERIAGVAELMNYPGVYLGTESELAKIAAGKGKGVIFKRGEMIRHVQESEMVDALLEEIDTWEKEEAARGTLKTEKRVEAADGRVGLPLLRS